MTNRHDALERRINIIAGVIEAVCFSEEIPLMIPEDGAAVLGDQCRFYAKKARGKDLDALKARLKKTQSNTYLKGHIASDSNLKRLRKDVSTILECELGCQVGIGVGKQSITFDFRLSDIMHGDYFIPLSIADLHMAPRKNKIPIGKTLEGDVIVWCPDDGYHHHVLIAGMTRSGKSTLWNTMMWGLANSYSRSEMQMMLMSGKPEDVVLWSGLPHLIAPVTTTPKEALAMISWAEEERRRRAEIPHKDKNFSRLLIFVGEIPYFADNCPPEFTTNLERLMKLGASEKIHVVVTTQYPRSDRVGSIDIKTQFPLRMCGMVNDPQSAYVALGVGGTGAELLPGRGSFVTSNDVRFQAAYFCDAKEPAPAINLVKQLQAQMGTPQYQDDIQEYNHDVQGQTMTDDAWDAMQKLISVGREKTSKNDLQALMGWGFPRASRCFETLIKKGVISEDRDETRKAEVYLDKAKEEVNA
jgi:S-DNA-T family DNA segregation ATPase FtsK/SpoIIIE